jgi:para-nitrobenzyl esterase
VRLLPAFLLLAACARIAPTPEALAGTSWQLVRFQGGDGKVLAPGERSKYTLAFNADGRVAARLDCNRATGSWKSAGPGRLELGPMAVTRAMCPPGSIDHEISKRLLYVRSYVMKDGRLFLSMMADGGVFELEPLP